MTVMGLFIVVCIVILSFGEEVRYVLRNMVRRIRQIINKDERDS